MMHIFKKLLLIIPLVALGSMVLVWLLPKQATALAIYAEHKRAGLTPHNITLDNGLNMVYLEGGHGEPLVLLHGFSANKENFTRIAGKLTSSYHVIIPDQIGFGESSHPADADYRTAAQAERLHQFLNKLNIQQIHLGGSSMGGQIALAYAYLYPKAVNSLWLLDPGGVHSAPQTAIFQTYTLTGKHPLIIDKPEQYDMVMHTAMNHPPYVPTPILHELAKESIANKSLLQTILPQLASDNIEARGKDVKTPTLIVWGDKDQLLDVQAAHILHQLMPQSKMIIMSDIGHLPMLEDVDQTAKDYLDFRTALKN